MIVIRKPDSIYQSEGAIENGSFRGRWHFSFDEYNDPEHEHFGPLRVFNDDTLSPGAVWPLHPHREIEVVTYCAEGEFRHADQNGVGNVLRKGWVQHTTVGRGMYHSEINNKPDTVMRFIQMWFIPSKRGLEPSVEQRPIQKKDRTNRLLPLVGGKHPDALPIFSDAEVYSCFLESGKSLEHAMRKGRGVYLYALEGGPISVNGNLMPALAAAEVTDEKSVSLVAQKDAEFLLVDVLL